MRGDGRIQRTGGDDDGIALFLQGGDDLRRQFSGLAGGETLLIQRFVKIHEIVFARVIILARAGGIHLGKDFAVGLRAVVFHHGDDAFPQHFGDDFGRNVAHFLRQAAKINLNILVHIHRQQRAVQVKEDVFARGA